MRKNTRDSGIDIIGEVPWGTHFCQFYQTKEDLTDILVPYFKAGLENNELCIWITSQPLEVEEAKTAMKKAVPDIDVYLEKGQIEIISYTHGYLNEGIFNPDRVVNSWVEKIDQSLARGYDGLRAAGDNRWLEKEGWNGFVDYENKVDAVIDKNHVIALCPYYLDMCSIAETIDVVSNHQFALIKREGKWERIENSGRRRAEKEAIQAAKNWRYTFDAVPDLVAIIDDKYKVVRANKAIAARLGVTPEECIGLTCYRVIHGTDKSPSFCPHRQLLKDGAEHTAEICEDCLGGNFLVSTSPLYDSEGKLIGKIYIARDITKQKQEEHRIRRYNHILEGINQIFNNVVQAKTEEELGNACLSVALEVTGSQFGIINEMDDDGLLHDVAKSELAWEQCLMYDKTGHRRPPSDFIVHGLYGSVIIKEKSFFTNDPQSHPDSIGLPSGHPPLTSFLGVPLVQDGKTMGLIAVANREGGYSCEQQEDLEAIAPAVTQALQRKRSEEALKRVHESLEEKVKERTVELEKAYNSLKESEKGLAEAQKMANIGNWNWDLLTGETYWSDEIYRIFGCNLHESSATYDEFLNYIHPEDRGYVDNAIKRALNEKPLGIDYRIITASGEERIVHAESEVILDLNNNPIRAKGIIQDITEKKMAEEALANLEIARKKEIHHRIKNNLQVISSLLDLQADKFDNLKVIEAFRESQNRVISMALIHEELYRGKGTNTLEFSAYLRKLAENLFQTYNLKSKNIHLNMNLEENAFFDMDVAVPLGIIVNELISNSLKHAFLDRDRGEIQIELHRDENGENKKEGNKSISFILTVSDNGISIPEDLNIKDLDSLGFQLITALVDQLDGELELKRNDGTEFAIRFTVKEENNQTSRALYNN